MWFFLPVKREDKINLIDGILPTINDEGYRALYLADLTRKEKEYLVERAEKLRKELTGIGNFREANLLEEAADSFSGQLKRSKVNRILLAIVNNTEISNPSQDVIVIKTYINNNPCIITVETFENRSITLEKLSEIMSELQSEEAKVSPVIRDILNLNNDKLIPDVEKPRIANFIKTVVGNINRENTDFKLFSDDKYELIVITRYSKEVRGVNVIELDVLSFTLSKNCKNYIPIGIELNQKSEEIKQPELLEAKSKLTPREKNRKERKIRKKKEKKKNHIVKAYNKRPC